MTKEGTLKISKMDYRGFQSEVMQKYGKNEDEVVGTALFDDGMRVIVSLVRRSNAWFTAELYDDSWCSIKGTKKESDDIMKFDGTEYENRDGRKYRLTVQLR